MILGISRICLSTCLLACAGLVIDTAQADDCREHGEAVGSAMLLDAIDATHAEWSGKPKDASIAAAIEAPKKADADGDWDITGTFGPTQTVRFSTDEGTWMNVDVHPSGDSLVFDLLGDLYTLPIDGGTATRISDGAAYDFQPRFNPDGDKLLFTSDRDGGFNIWVADYEDGELGEPEVLTGEKTNVTDGGFWDPSGDWIYARKRFTDVSSIGVSGVWTYHVDGGSGFAVVDHNQVGEVDTISATRDGRWLYIGTRPPFGYNQNPFGSIWAIQRFDRIRGELEPVSVGLGSSAVPLLSPDEQTLAFIRRVDGKTTLWLHDLASGAERQVWDGLDRDQLESFATHGVYPGYDWTPNGQHLVVWAQGGLFKIAAFDDTARATPIPFEAEVEQQLHETLRGVRAAVEEDVTARIIRWPVQSPDGQSLVFQALGRLYRMQLPDGAPDRLTDADDFELSPAFSPDGKTMVFASWNDEDGGALHRMELESGESRRIYSASAQLANPAFSPDGEAIVFTQGSGANLRGQDLGSELRHDLFVVPADGGAAQFVISTANRGPNRRITRPMFGPEGERIYYFEDLPGSGGGERGSRQPQKTGLVSVSLDGLDHQVHLRFRYAQEAVPNPQLTHVAFTELHNAYVIPMPGLGKTLDVKAGSLVPVATLSWDGGEWVDWTDGGQTVTWSFGSEFRRMALDDLAFDSDAAPRPDDEEEIDPVEVAVTDKGDYLYAGKNYKLEKLGEKLKDLVDADPQPKVKIDVDDNAPFSAWKGLEEWLEEQELSFELAQKDDEAEGDDADDGDAEDGDDADVEPELFHVELTVPRATPDGVVALVGARIVTMNGDEVIEDGTVLVENDRITHVGRRGKVRVPAGAEVVDVSGKTIIPGLVDVHAHMGYGVLDVSPQLEWRYYANLAYGVTTTHDPSASTHTVFGQREMVEAGIMVGPRIYSTGFILYGATNPDMAPINSYEDALSHVRRLKQLGAFSVKSYQQPRRDQRQWILKAAREEDMLVVPEGGGDFEGNMSMILDGHSGIEHALSVAPIYDDVVQLFARSKVGYTPTLLVAYGGQFGERWFYQHYDVWTNEKLQSFHPPRMISARARRRSMAPEEDYNHKTVAEGCRDILRAGGLVNMGAHGQLQGLGAHWEMWAMTHGGMTPHEALQVSTINGARYLGMDGDLGSIEPGKLADLVVLELNPLERIENSDSVTHTMINGVLYDASSMDELWPTRQARGRFPFETNPMSHNPLLAESWDTPFGVPPLDEIRGEHYMPAFREAMRRHNVEIADIVSNPEAPTFENTVEALEVSGPLLSRVAGAFYPRRSAHTDDKIREVSREIAPLMSAHSNDVYFNKPLYERVRVVFEQRDSLALTLEQMRLLTETHKSFVRSGVNLSDDARARIRDINGELAELSTTFGENLLSETNAYELIVEDTADLGSLPASLVSAAASEARRRDHEKKYVFTLQRPSINPFLEYSTNRDLRQNIFDGYAMRGDNDNDHDNKLIVARIVELRAERAKLMGYESHAHYVLEDQMAENPDQVFDLLKQIWPSALSVAQREADDLEAMMHSEGVDGELTGADWRFYTERVRKQRYDLDADSLRPYFEVNAVLDGAFTVAGKLFGITFEPLANMPVWHPDQQVFEVKEADGGHLGILYLDFFARESKRGGAWENTIRAQSNVDGFVTPIVTTNFNFPPPTEDSPSLLSLTESSTLFHELGHALHDLLSQVTYESLAGTSVPRDFVEFPSQVMENWMSEPEVLRMFARHYETGEVIPDDLIEKIEASSKFNQGFETVEYIAAAYLDLNWHTLKYGKAEIDDVRGFEEQAMQELDLIDEILPRYRSTYFAHIFSGGYSSGYYSYVWSEVLDADAFEAFKEVNLFDQQTAERFRRLLARGGSRAGMELYREFRGRDPEIGPLLNRRGLSAQ